jgi:hypothetical protein
MSNGTDIPNVLKFGVTAMYVTEPAGALAPINVIAKDEAFKLSCDFYIDRWLGKGLNNLKFPPTNQQVLEYNVNFYADKVGTGPNYDFPVGTDSKHITCITGQYSYGPAETSITIPPNTMVPGTYELTCVVKMSPIGGGSSGFPSHVLGFIEGPMIDIYDPAP